MGNGWPGLVGIIRKCLGTEPNYGLAILLPAEASRTHASWRAAGQNPLFNLRGLPTAPCSPSHTQAAPEVAALDIRDSQVRVLKRSLEISIDPAYLSEPEPIEFPTSNGLTAFALFYAPKNRDFVPLAGERPPLLVTSHGGPTSATTPA